MKYFNDMCNKWGFSDGAAVPDTADVYREVYVTALNCIAEKLGSQTRVVAYDRPGMHNWCMIVCVSKETAADIHADIISRSLDESDIADEYTLASGLSGEVVCLDDIVEMDEAMLKAIEYARELGLDNYVVERAEVEGFNILIENINACKDITDLKT